MIDLADAHYPVSIDRARERLHFEPLHRLRSSLDEMALRLRANPARWYRTNGFEVPEEIAASGSKD
jgi:hypothetical protein